MNSKIIKPAFLLLLITFSSNTFSFVTSHITKLEKKGLWDSLIYFTIDTMSDNDEDPNPCFEYNSAFACTFGVIRMVNGHPQVFDVVYSIDAKPFKTMGDLAKAWKKFYSLPFNGGTISASGGGDVKFPDCMSIAVMKTLSHNFEFTLYPGLACGRLPPVELNCFIADNITINYGTILSTEIDHSYQQQNATITCNNAATISLYIIGTDGGRIPLTPNGNLQANLKINGKAATEGIKIDVKEDIDSPIKISAELLKTGEIDAGPFHGSASIIMLIE